ncbi:MAG TPA: hypothetical protein VHA76_15960 [Solirubrobacterales bacterium]|nr:hypothetical protein [Solirubrobacterales bacterium]
MFNPLGADELIAGMGRTMRAAARAEGPLDDFARGQLLSGASIAGLLAAELASREALLRRTRRRLGEEIAAAGADPTLDAAAGRIAAADDGDQLGAALGDLLAELRDGRDPELRGRLLAVLREMTELELAALAGERVPPEAGR